APSALPFAPCDALARALTDMAPDTRGVQFRMFLFDLRGQRSAHGLVTIEGYLMYALRFAQLMLFGAKEPWILNRLARAGHGKDLQAHIKADFLPGRWQWSGDPFTGEGDKPLAGRGAANGGRLEDAFERTV